MPRETVDIQLFDKGLVTSLSDIDASDAICTFGSKDIDPDSVDGVIQGRLDDTNIADSFYINRVVENPHGLIQNSDGTVDIAYKSDDTVRMDVNFPDDTNDTVIVASLENIKSLTVFGRSIRVGGYSDLTMPQWIGDVGANQFSSPLPTGYLAVDTYCKTPGGCTLTVGETVAGSGGLKSTSGYNYRIGYEYDGFQFSPMHPTPFAGVTTTGEMDITVLIPETELAQISPRVTAVNLYRAEVVGGVVDQYVFCKRIDINDAGWTPAGLDMEIDVSDDGTSGATFDDFAGFSETLSYSFVKYRIGCVINGFFVVGQCQTLDSTLTEDAPFMLFRSAVNRPDTFNWATYFCRLPNYPLALAGFQGRAYAFDANHVYRINPSTMGIEDKIDGIGCLGQDAVIANEYGMFFADANGIHMHDGSTIIPIGAPISSIWRQLVTISSTVSLRFNAATKSFFATIHGDDPVIFAYSIERKRWDYFTVEFDGDNNQSSIVGANGVIYMFKENGGVANAVSFGTAATRKGWTYITKNFTMASPTQHKRLYQVSAETRAGSAPTVTISIDGASYVGTFTVGQMFKAVRLKIVGSATTVVESASIMFRRLIGLR